MYYSSHYQIGDQGVYVHKQKLNNVIKWAIYKHIQIWKRVALFWVAHGKFKISNPIFWSKIWTKIQ